MRDETDLRKLEAFLRELGNAVTSPGRIYLTGGGTAVLHGWRGMTIDVALKADPEPNGLFEAIARLKDSLSLNVELAFRRKIPFPGFRNGKTEVFSSRVTGKSISIYDLYSQALSKLERSHARDELDVRAMVDRGLVDKSRLWELFEVIESGLLRYPAVDGPGVPNARR